MGKGMTMRIVQLAVLLIIASISMRWSADAYPNCPSDYNTGGTKYYNGDDDANEGTSSSSTGGQPLYYQEQYVDQWSPYNGIAMPRVCTDPASNPRGYYTTNLAPCRLQFHKVSNDDAGAAGDASSSSYELSTACSNANQVGKMAAGSALYEYVSNWPDECVGSFKRCYSVTQNERVFLAEVCRHGLVFPDGTTHVSLDCSDDRTMKQEAMDKMNNNKNNNLDGSGGPENDPYLRAQQKRQEDEIHEAEKVIFVIIAVVLVSCLGCMCAAYVLVIIPHQETIRETRRSERDGLMNHDNADDDDDVKTKANISTTNTASKNGGGRGRLSEVQMT
jgi:hypothetical protein